MAKPGLDGHDVGAKIVARALRDAGMEVLYTGLRRSPQQIAHAALEEDVAVGGLSILSGAHIPLCRRLSEAFSARNTKRPVWIVGGVIPQRDHEALEALGVDAIFPTRTPFEDVVDYIRKQVAS